jgi:hypothetical protein
MIPRYQLVVFRVLVGSCLLMAVLMIRGCVRNHERLIAQRDLSPIPAPTDIPDEAVSVALANDTDGSITLDQEQMALPQEGPLRARAILRSVFARYALPASLHPLPGGPAILTVFFVQLPVTNPAAGTLPDQSGQLDPTSSSGTGQLAVIDLKGAFADAHPSGIETEDLTLRSIIGTLHANFPEVEQVRFLVDGKTRDTLAGHADLAHVYPAADTTRSPLHTLDSGGRNE